MCLLVSGSSIKKADILHSDLVGFFGNAIQNEMMNVSYALHFLSAAMYFKDLKEEVLEHKYLMDAIVSHSEQMIHKDASSNLKVLLFFWTNLDIRSQVYDSRVAGIVYSVAVKVIINYDDFLYQKEQVDESTLADAAVLIDRVLH